MSDQLDLVAEYRTDTGKGSSRRLRHEGKVPAIVYGAGRPPRNITLDQNSLLRQAQNESFFSSVLTVKVGDRTQPCILKDIQVHPAKRQVLHLDLQRIVANEKIRMDIPLHFIGIDTCPGVKLNGGAVSQVISEVEVSCLPANLPEYIEVDLSNMDLDQTVHLSDLVIPEGVELLQLSQGEEHSQPVASCQLMRVAEVEEDEDEEAVEASEVPTGASEEGSEED
ncbi:MAG: 50S ribosomal protein L25/general stress protein Ctc [Gammaproteobacteria bacterium]|nr:50S ribosomal protein L25/general stress protein Ctc [Gammaproteobacteria bacterium]